MRLKRFAIRALVALAVVVFVCMFFARTVLTITTAKVQLVTPTTGKLEEKLTFQAAVNFPDTVEVTVEEAGKSPILIRKVLVKEGQKVTAGDVIYTCEMPSYEEDMNKLQATYDEKNRALLDLDVKNHGVSKVSRQNDLYNEMLAAQEEMTNLATRARTLAASMGLVLSSDLSQWRKQLSAQGDDVTQELRKAANLALAARETYQTAYDAFFAVLEDRKLRVSTEVFEYIRERDALLEAMEEAASAMAELSARVVELSKVTSPHDGYIISADLKAGDTYDGSKPAFTMTAADSGPTLRIQIPDTMKRTISDGTKAELVSDAGTEKTTVEKTAADKDGKRYLYLVIPDTYLNSSTGLRKLMGESGVTVNITYRSKNSTTLLPPSAVRNEGEGNDYVYLIQRSSGGFMSASNMKVVKTTVTVLERTDKAVSLSDDLSYQQVADREDRAISDGQTVMEYVK